MTKPRDIGAIHEVVNDTINNYMKYIAPEPYSQKSNDFILLLKLQIVTLMMEERNAWQKELGNE